MADDPADTQPTTVPVNVPTTVTARPAVTAAVVGALKDITVWLGVFLVALPEIWTAVGPIMVDLLGPDAAKRLGQAVGVVVVVVRIVVTKGSVIEAGQPPQIREEAKAGYAAVNDAMGIPSK